MHVSSASPHRSAQGYTHAQSLADGARAEDVKGVGVGPGMGADMEADMGMGGMEAW